MPPEPVGPDAEIAAARNALATEVDPDRIRALRVALATALGARFVGHGGADADRVEADALAELVLADPAATPQERRALSLLRPTLTMMSATPAAALRGHGPVLDSEALRRTEQWRADTDPAAALAGLDQLAAQLDAVDPAELPSGVRWALDVVRTMSGLLTDVQRPEWNGEVSPEVAVRLRAATAAAPPGAPGAELLRGLTAWVDPAADRVAALQAAIAGLTGGDLLRPVLEGDLARALLRGRGELRGPAALREATRLLEAAVAGMPQDHPLRDPTVGMLAGALVATAAGDRSPARRTDARELATALVAAGPATADAAGRGAHRFLTALVGLLHALADDPPDTSAAVGDLVAAIALLPVGHALRPVAVGQLGAVLADRHLMDGLLANGDDAVRLLERAAGATAADAGSGDGDPAAGAFVGAVAAVARIGRATRTGDATELAVATAALREGLARIPASHPLRANLEIVLGTAELSAAARDGAGAAAAVARLRRTLAGGAVVGIAPSVIGTLADTLDLLDGLGGPDPTAVRRALGRLESGFGSGAGDGPGFRHELAGRRALLGAALLAAHDTGAGPSDLADRAVEQLEEALGVLGDRGGDVLRIDVLRNLTIARWVRGDRAAARRAGFDQLTTYAAVVLLQSGVGDALRTARGAAEDATRLMRWCLADGDLQGAVQALELGRGLTLRAATSTADVPRLMTGLGHADLAEAWRAAAADRRIRPARGVDDGPGEPDYARAADDVRRRTLDVLRSSREGRALFAVPGAATIGSALAALGRDALAYLVPGDATTGGHILVVDRDGRIAAVEAPRLRLDAEDPLSVYLRTDRFGEFGQATIWSTALERLCAWAGTAAVEPLLAALRGRPGSGPGGAPRVVVVPCGPLGAVPWPAALLPAGPAGPRYACQDLVLSVAASARQLRDVAGRAAADPAGTPLLVTGPSEGLPGIADEVATIRAAFYPDAAVLGSRATPQEFLARFLPGPGEPERGPTVVHVGCHGTATGSLDTSQLELAAPLSLRTLLEQATARHRDTPHPTVVLAACDADLTRMAGDEALTLATAFVVAGAAGVVGARWSVDDRATAVAMFALHHHLVAERMPAADALRATQLWMLDPRRSALPGMSARMARDASRGRLSEVALWAAFGHHGR